MSSKKSSFSITNLWILSGIFVFAAGGWWFKSRFDTGQKLNKENHFYQDLKELTPILEKRWKEGDLEGHYSLGKFNCPTLIQNGAKIHPSYFQCNPYYMACYLSGKTGSKTSEKFKFAGFGHGRRGRLETELIHLETGKKANFKFKDTCGNILLPSSVYSAGPKEGSKNIWDNYGQKILIDKNYVTNGEVEIWLRSLGEHSGIVVRDYHRPSTILNKGDKRKFCQFRGGQLLQSRYFDAATFLPSEVKNNYVYKFPFPWTKRKDAIGRLGEKNCEKIFSKECGVENYENHSTYSPSWSGIYNSLGSYAESFDNKFLPVADLKMSSMLLPLNSPWHRLGLRGGTSDPDDVDSYNGIKLEMPPQNIRSAFRCVYYR